VRFDQKVYAMVCQIPSGQVCAYGDVAAAMGSPRAARQVGFALARLPLDRVDEVPWHRVINGRGMISGRGDLLRPELQEQLLEGEGIAFSVSGRCDLNALRFLEFEPL
jgi:methylated-DNA-protein-cysteine methyltransferase-like protein